MKSVKYLKKLLIFAFFYIPLTLFAQEKLTNHNASWSSVLTGTPLCEPAITSYGFCIATDARNIMGFSTNGTLLWDKSIGRVRNLSLTALPGDFVLFYDKSNKILRLINPSGSEIWSKALDFSLYSSPFAGRDGRFFIYGEKQIQCLGINGNCRWSLETPLQKKLPVQELPDGSIILFLADEKGFTKGLRISPFGEKLENITFAGSIKDCWTCSEGVLLSFTDGSAGLFSIENGLAVNRWVAQSKGENSVFAVSPDRTSFVLITLSANSATVHKLDTKNGNSIQSRKFSEIKGNEIELYKLSDSGLFLCDKNTAFLIGNELNTLWEAKMPDIMKTKKVSYLSYINENYFLVFDKNWSINAYHTNQTINTKNNKTVLKNIHNDYSSFISIDSSGYSFFDQSGFYSSVKNPSIAEEITNGLYGIKEQDWLTQTISLARLYSLDSTSSDFGIHTTKSVFDTDSAGFENILIQLSLLCTAQTQNALSDIISKSKNKSYCKILMANLYGYDPDGKLLDALERNAQTAGNKDAVYLNTICDAVYSVCLFMGRPAYNKKGKEIIKKLMGTGYPSSVRNYARDTLKKIITLEL